MEDPLRLECIAAIEDHPMRGSIRTDAEFEARVQFCMREFEALRSGRS